MKETKSKLFKPLEDLLIKLQKIYNDFYIFRQMYCIPGIGEQPDSILGIIVCKLEPQYIDAVKLLMPNTECIYISSAKELREDLRIKTEDNKPLDFYPEESRYGNLVSVKDEDTGYCYRCVTKMEERFLMDRIWICIGEQKELLQTIYTDKKIFNLPIRSITKEDTNEYATIAKQLLPLITEKNSDTSFLSMMKLENDEDLYELLIDFHFTHFRMKARYHVIPIPKE